MRQRWWRPGIFRSEQPGFIEPPPSHDAHPAAREVFRGAHTDAGRTSSRARYNLARNEDERATDPPPQKFWPARPTCLGCGVFSAASFSPSFDIAAPCRRSWRYRGLRSLTSCRKEIRPCGSRERLAHTMRSQQISWESKLTDSASGGAGGEDLPWDVPEWELRSICGGGCAPRALQRMQHDCAGGVDWQVRALLQIPGDEQEKSNRWVERVRRAQAGWARATIRRPAERATRLDCAPTRLTPPHPPRSRTRPPARHQAPGRLFGSGARSSRPRPGLRAPFPSARPLRPTRPTRPHPRPAPGQQRLHLDPTSPGTCSAAVRVRRASAPPRVILRRPRRMRFSRAGRLTLFSGRRIAVHLCSSSGLDGLPFAPARPASKHCRARHGGLPAMVRRGGVRRRRPGHVQLPRAADRLDPVESRTGPLAVPTVQIGKRR